MIERLHAALKVHRPDYDELFKPGATDEEIARLEAQVGVPVPPLLIELLRRSNGTADFKGLEAGWRYGHSHELKHVDDILRTKAAMDAFDADGLTFSTWTPGEWWNPAWIPFLDNRSYDMCVIDTAGCWGGPAGQILKWSKDSNRRRVLHSSFERWLEEHIARLEAGLYVMDGDGFHVDYDREVEANSIHERIDPDLPDSYEVREVGMVDGWVDPRGRTEDMHAVLRGDHPVLEGHPNAADDDGNTALHLAAWRGNQGWVQALLAAGADKTALNASGKTPLDMALGNEQVQLVVDLAGAGLLTGEHLAIALRKGDADLVGEMIALGVDVNAPDGGRAEAPAWFSAANPRRASLLPRLLEAGADLDARDRFGHTALHVVAITRRPGQLLADLVGLGMEVDARRATDGTTPLMVAAKMGRAGNVSQLLAAGADKTLRDDAGHTALDQATEHDKIEVIALLE